MNGFPSRAPLRAEQPVAVPTVPPAVAKRLGRKLTAAFNEALATHPDFPLAFLPTELVDISALAVAGRRML